jgi:hypothetical protein
VDDSAATRVDDETSRRVKASRLDATPKPKPTKFPLRPDDDAVPGPNPTVDPRHTDRATTTRAVAVPVPVADPDPTLVARTTGTPRADADASNDMTVRSTDDPRRRESMRRASRTRLTSTLDPFARVSPDAPTRSPVIRANVVVVVVVSIVVLIVADSAPKPKFTYTRLKHTRKPLKHHTHKTYVLPTEIGKEDVKI